MYDAENPDRVLALQLAADRSTRLYITADDVVKEAEKFYAFLIAGYAVEA